MTIPVKRANAKSLASTLVIIALAGALVLLERTSQREQLDRQLVNAVSAHHDTEIKKLIQMGADINSREYENTRLDSFRAVFGSVKRLVSSSRDRHFNAGRGLLLLYYGTSVSIALNDGQEISGSAPDEEIALSLLTPGPSINEFDLEGRTILCFAVKYRHHKLVNLLLENGADPNVNKEFGLRCPLHYADKYDANSLLEHGANIDCKDESGATPLILACSDTGLAPVADELLKHDSNANWKDNMGRTALICASSNSTIDIVKRLIKSGAKTNVSSKSGVTPLIAALMNPDMRVFRYLLQQKCDINSRGPGGNTALTILRQARQWAVDMGNSCDEINRDIYEVKMRGAVEVKAEYWDSDQL